MLSDETKRADLRAEVRDKQYKPAAECASGGAHCRSRGRHRQTVELRPCRWKKAYTAASGRRRSPDRTWWRFGGRTAKPNRRLGRDVLTFRREDGVAENFHTSQNRELLEKLARADRRAVLPPAKASQAAERDLLFRSGHHHARDAGSVGYAGDLSAGCSCCGLASGCCAESGAWYEDGVACSRCWLALSCLPAANATTSPSPGWAASRITSSASAAGPTTSIQPAEGRRPTPRSTTLFGPAATEAAIQDAFGADRQRSQAAGCPGRDADRPRHFDGADYKINLPGPDISAAELAALLDRVPATRQLVVNMTSASGGSIEALQKAEPRS